LPADQRNQGSGRTEIKQADFCISVARDGGSESRSPSCPIEAAPSASGVVCRGQTKSRQDFSGSGIWEGPSGTDGGWPIRACATAPQVWPFLSPIREPVSRLPVDGVATDHRWPSISNRCFPLDPPSVKRAATTVVPRHDRNKWLRIRAQQDH